MQFHVLASGSKGNCTVVTNGKSSLIIDCGAPVTYLKKAFEQIGFDCSKADGLLITHCHIDHIRLVNHKIFSSIPVYSAFPIAGIKNNQEIVENQIFKVGDFTILPIPLSHDVYTIGFIIFDGSETLVYLTDTGYVSERNLGLIKNAQYYIFESNHDPELLMKTIRPYPTKQRIIGDCGHLSNADSANLLTKCVCQDTKDVVLAHISQEANTYDLAYQTAKAALEQKGLLHAGLRLKAIEQFEIYKGGNI